MRSLVVLIVSCLLCYAQSKPLEGFSYNVTVNPELSKFKKMYYRNFTF